MRVPSPELAASGPPPFESSGAPRSRRPSLHLALFLVPLLAACGGPPSDAEAPVTLGSKKFTESVILGAISAQLLRAEDIPTRHRRELGGTAVLWEALRRGEIDVYPEYTGTLREEILLNRASEQGASLEEGLASLGIEMSRPLGFNNTYALGMQEAVAERLGIRRLSDLRSHPELALGFSNEFMDRADGWPALKNRYALPHSRVRGLDHDLAYRALTSGAIQVTDLYSTDAEIQSFGLRVLEDDLRHFPSYEAVLLWRKEWGARRPEAVEALRRLEGRVSVPEMVLMNAAVRIDKRSERAVAADFLSRELGLVASGQDEGRVARLVRYTREHLSLVLVSLLAAVLVSVPLGVFAARRPRAGQVLLAAAGAIQTIPALALLVFMIPLLGIGGRPAVVALFLYSLLPIIRNTAAGLRGIPEELRESAEALGLPSRARLFLVELPMASRSILAGIKTSAVINVGTATLGALVGAGGFGQPILTGIRLDDTALILEGSIPAAVLALAVQGLFEGAERLLVPRGLRLGESR